MKGIAIETILLLVVGILVVGIVIFLVHKYVRSKIISEAECQSRLSEICVLCKNANWDAAWPTRGSDNLFFEVIDNCKTYSKFSNFLVCKSLPDTSCHCSTLQDPCKILGVK